MKKLFFLTVSLLVSVAMLMTACKKDNPKPDNADNQETPGGGTTSVNWVDLGLPSGLLWADCNVGAQKPEDYGNFYAWGETSAKGEYNWDTYAYGSGSFELTKYCGMPLYGLNDFTDSLTTLEASDDVAMVKLGDGARIPTKAEWQELKAKTTNTWTTRNGVYGCLLTASNGNSIFLPAAGRRENMNHWYMGSAGYYWSSSVMTEGPSDAWIFQIFSSGNEFWSLQRCYGLSVRAVRASQN